VLNTFNISKVSSVSNMSNGWNMYHHPRSLIQSTHKCSPGENSPGEEKGCCTIADPCPEHVGDCDADDECKGKLKCNLNHQGSKFGYAGHSVDVCGYVGPAVRNTFNISHVSSVSNMSNGWNMYHHPRSLIQADAHKCSPGENSPGEKKGCCTIADPCPENVGDCDADNECQGKLKCNLNHQGSKFGYKGRSVDVCGYYGPAVWNTFNISHVSSVSNMSNGWNMYHHPGQL
jgi:ribosome modulation factor